MKCKKPNTDQEITLSVFENGLELSEYVLPLYQHPDPNTIECFVPVSNGKQITLHGAFKGSVLHGSFDLLVDGSFLLDKRQEGAKSGQVKRCTRKLNIDKVLDTPKPEGYTSIYMPRHVVEGTLHVQPLDQDLPAAQGSKLGVGSIAVIVSVNQKPDDMYANDYASPISADWKERDHSESTDGGIPPTHELAVKVTDDQLHINRQSKHRRHFDQSRFGPKPWAKIIFYYRDTVAIERAGCVRRNKDHIIELEPDVSGNFIFDKSESKKNKKKAEVEPQPVKQLDGEHREADNEDAEDDVGDEIVVKPLRKNSLSRTNSASPSKIATNNQTIQMPNGRRGSGGLFMSPSPTDMRGHDDFMREHDEENDYDNGDFLPDAEADDAPGATAEAFNFDRKAENHRQALQPEGLSQRQRLEEQKKTSQAAATFPAAPRLPVAQPTTSGGRLSRCVITREDIVALASSHGIISSQAVSDFSNAHDISVADGHAAIKRFADKVGGMYVLKDRKGGVAGEPSQPNRTNNTTSATRTEGGDHDPGMPVKEESSAQPMAPTQGNPAATTTNVPSPSNIQVAQTPSSLKRTVSNDTLSRESTPSKKSKLAELRAKKAAILAANEKKAMSNQAFKKDLEDERKRKEEDEAKELREIERLERESAALDKEEEDLNRQREEMMEEEE